MSSQDQDLSSQSCGHKGSCDDHVHFTLFSTISQMLRDLFSAVVETLANPFPKDNEKQPVPLWFALLNVITLGAPIILTPIIFALAHYIARFVHLSKALFHDLRTCRKRAKLRSWVHIACVFIVPIFILPLFCSKKALFSGERLVGHNDDISESTLILTKVISLSIVCFASLGVGFIAVSAVATTTLAASLGGGIWLFFVAGFLSEWQTLELSVTKFMNNLFSTGDMVWLSNFNDTDKISNIHTKKTLQRLGFIITLIVAVGLGALTYTHTYGALIALAQFSSISLSISFIQVLTPIIAACTAIAFGILIFKCVRDAICDKDHQNLFTKAKGNLSNVWNQDTHVSVKLAKTLLWSSAYIISLGLTVFYVLTAGPAWAKAAKTIFQSELAAKMITYCFYPIYTLFFTVAAMKTFDHIIAHGQKLGHSFSTFMAQQAKRAAYLFEGKGLFASCGIGLLLLVETIMKMAVVITLDIGMTLGMFLLHLVGDAAVGAEEEAPFGMNCWSVLLVDSLAHAVLDGGFLLEWALGDLDHSNHNHLSSHAHSDQEQDEPKINRLYALFCLTLIGPLLHGLCYRIARKCGQKWESPKDYLIRRPPIEGDANDTSCQIQSSDFKLKHAPLDGVKPFLEGDFSQLGYSNNVNTLSP